MRRRSSTWLGGGGNTWRRSAAAYTNDWAVRGPSTNDVPDRLPGERTGAGVTPPPRLCGWTRRRQPQSQTRGRTGSYAVAHGNIIIPRSRTNVSASTAVIWNGFPSQYYRHCRYCPGFSFCFWQFFFFWSWFPVVFFVCAPTSDRKCEAHLTERDRCVSYVGVVVVVVVIAVHNLLRILYGERWNGFSFSSSSFCFDSNHQAGFPGQFVQHVHQVILFNTPSLLYRQTIWFLWHCGFSKAW